MQHFSRSMLAAAGISAFLLPICGIERGFAAQSPQYALSEIKKEAAPAPAVGVDPEVEQPFPGNTVPLPSETTPPADDSAPADEPDETLPADGEEPGPDDETGQAGRPHIDPNAPLPEIVYDISRLPEPTRRMWQLMVDACLSGDVEKLRPLIGLGDDATQLALGGLEGDPIKYLKDLSGDSEGQEILAILLEVLQAGYVHLDAGTPEELYVWPYFFAIPLDRLDARQRVELFKIVTAGDYEDMKSYGAYIFYRAGIDPEGRWTFFVAGD